MHVDNKSKHPIIDTYEGNSFFLHQFNNTTLAVFTYYVESEKEAIIIDPLRDVDSYLDVVKERGSELKYIYLTHFHADFVSGHFDLAHKTGATIVFGPSAITKYKSYVLKDEEVINLGKIQIKTLHTPGHTLESSCFLLIADNKPFCVFTGDTLFMGDVGRPDLAVKGEEITENDLAGMLYNSIQTKLKNLPDEVVIYPAHGAGSACGKNIGTGFKCTMGAQKKNNYALNISSKDEFIAKVTLNLPFPPQYFFYDAFLNKEGCPLFEDAFKGANKALSVDEFEKYVNNKEAVIIDARDIGNISSGYIPSSVGISLKCPFNSFVGKLIKPKTTMALVTEKGTESEAITQLLRIGYDSIDGYLSNGFDSWKEANKPQDSVKTLKAEEVKQPLEEKKQFLDVREPNEWDQGTVGVNTIKIPLSQLEKRMDEIPKDQDIYCYCKSSMRGVMAVSTLQKFGFKNQIYNIQGGIEKMREVGITIDEFKP